MKTISLLLLSILLIFFTANAQSTNGTIRFTLKDAETTQLINGSVKLVSGDFSSQLNTSNGIVEFTVPTGRYQNLVSANTYRDQNSHYDIVANKILDIEVWMEATGTSKNIKTDNRLVDGYLVDGYILDEKSEPITGAVVTVGVSNEKAISNQNGYFLIKTNPIKNFINIQNPRFNVFVEKDGYKKYIYSDLLLNTGGWRIFVNMERGVGETNKKYFQKILDDTSFNTQHDDEWDESKNSNTIMDEGNNKRVFSLANKCIPPPVIRVLHGENEGSCKSDCDLCLRTTQMELERYVRTGLDNEWIPGWGIEALKAGAVAYRTFGANGIMRRLTNGTNWDVRGCQQNWDGAIQIRTDLATTATQNEILIDAKGKIADAYYAAETNNQGCGDGFTGCGGYCTPNLSGVSWECNQDQVCKGYSKDPKSHGAGMCQNGSNRWAGGDNSGENKSYTWILDHYYNIGGIKRCTDNGVNVAFVIDDTYSMTNDLEAVKQSTLDILNDPTFIEESDGKLFQLTHFKDGVSQFDPTTDLDVLKDEVNSLSASGGDDCPEASVDAINLAQQNMSYGGEIYTATDANSRGVVSREDVNSNLLAKNILENDILTGVCATTLTSKNNPQLKINLTPTDVITSSENTNSKKVALSESEYIYNSIETFSYMASVTGGVYSFIPEIKSGSAEAFTRYKNTWFNMVLGSVTPTIAFVNPTQGQLGGQLALTINGIRTHFNPSTSVSFTDPGITIGSVLVQSPTQLQVLITIDKNVSLDFKDIIAVTPLANDSIEKAFGKGVLQIKTASTFPTILSIAPYSGAQGQKMTAQITGINTHFSNSSILNLGDGITVQKVTALSPEIIEADITIATNANPGYRDVTITTGSEIARETVNGPFLVLHSDCDISGLDLGSDTLIEKSKGDTCITLEVKGINKDSLSAYSFLWSTGATTPTIQVCPDTTTTYGVTVLKGTCKFTDEITVSVTNDNKPQLSVMDLAVDKNKNIAFVKVKLMNPQRKVVVAKYVTKDSTARKGEDYASINGFVTFIPRVNTTALIPIRLLHKDQITGNKYFKVILSSAINAEIIDSTAVVTIICDGSKSSESLQKITYNNKVPITEKNNLQIVANPNPSSNSFKIKVIGNEKVKANLSIYNETGVLIEQRMDIEGKTIEIGNNYKPGVYLIQVIQGNEKRSKKIVKTSR